LKGGDLTVTELTPRERVLKTLSHKEPDRVPVDLGSIRNTGITVNAYEKLVKYLHLESGNGPSLSKTGAITHRLAVIDEPVLQRLHVDLRGFMPGPPDEGEQVHLGDGRYRDEWSIVRQKVESTGEYTPVGSPLPDEVTVSDLARWPWPNPDDPGRVRGLRAKALALREKTDYAIVLHLADMFVGISQMMLGWERWFVEFALNPRLVSAVMDAVGEVRLAIAERVLDEVGDFIDVVSLSDNLGDQRGPQISPSSYHKYIKGRQKRFFDRVRERTSARILYHSSGSIYKLLPGLIEAGVEILNPVQVSAVGMDSARLKQEFGRDLVFWGGIDTQRVLPFGSRSEVREEVARRITDLASGGGYIVAAVHVIQPDVPPGNIVALYDAAQELGEYPIQSCYDEYRL
jgi:uroporphyrinogen decarboxylase